MAIQGYGNLAVRIMPDTARVRLKKNGLQEGECSFECIGEPGTAGAILRGSLPLGLAHPYNAWCWMETCEVVYTAKGAMAMCTYAGAMFENLDTPVYELVIGMEESPIETHPQFKDFAGKPSAPLNGALFLDPSTGQPSNDDAAGVFDRFLPFIAGDKNPKAGIESFLDPGVTYRESYVTQSLPSISGVGDVSGDVPGPGFPGKQGKRNWLYTGFNYRQRGNPNGQVNEVIYEISNEWKLSGRNGWDEDIYTN